MNSTDKNSSKTLRWDILLIGGLIVLFGIFALFYMTTRDEGDKVIVRVSGEVTATYTLDDEIDTVIEGKDGGTNRLIIHDGKTWVQDATCPDKLCENMGKVHTSGESIVCLPNEVVVEIHGADDGDIDVMAK